ncbi:hypothetical protein Pyn_11974 [Prunus yedoensis var. nudiflora]|uniref:Uncharacterized protein n=1 Tax=Prunus yedoensis var. nudiflora TaxID=2094558 RepID=A0A314Y4T2_PRUYE|nr:hypothetical protein Pyn_11974 [Prunus yedoensis var. nudiflora]
MAVSWEQWVLKLTSLFFLLVLRLGKSRLERRWTWEQMAGTASAKRVNYWP